MIIIHALEVCTDLSAIGTDGHSICSPSDERKKGYSPCRSRGTLQPEFVSDQRQKETTPCRSLSFSGQHFTTVGKWREWHLPILSD